MSGGPEGSARALEKHEQDTAFVKFMGEVIEHLRKEGYPATLESGRYVELVDLPVVAVGYDADPRMKGGWHVELDYDRKLAPRVGPVAKTILEIAALKKVNADRKAKREALDERARGMVETILKSKLFMHTDGVHITSNDYGKGITIEFSRLSPNMAQAIVEAVETVQGIFGKQEGADFDCTTCGQRGKMLDVATWKLACGHVLYEDRVAHHAAEAHSEIAICEAQTKEDARADAAGEAPMLIATMSDVAKAKAKVSK